MRRVSQDDEYIFQYFVFFNKQNIQIIGLNDKRHLHQLSKL